MTVRIDRVVTEGVFSLDGSDFSVSNNVWIIGDEREVVVVDAAHDAAAILDAVQGRRVVAVICTHAHNDHINAARVLAVQSESVVQLHPDDQVLWDRIYPEFTFAPVQDGHVVEVAGVEIRVIHTPGHSPGGVCLWVPEMATLFTGDTLFEGGPGATGRSYSDFATILQSIRERVLTLPPHTRVLTGHGAETTVGAELAGNESWDVAGR